MGRGQSTAQDASPVRRRVDGQIDVGHRIDRVAESLTVGTTYIPLEGPWANGPVTLLARAARAGEQTDFGTAPWPDAIFYAAEGQEAQMLGAFYFAQSFTPISGLVESGEGRRRFAEAFTAARPSGHVDAREAREAVKAAAQSVRRQFVEQIAAALHERWRAERRTGGNAFEPRFKNTEDAEWIRRNGTDQVDIANTGYVDLPSDWQADNKASAEVVVDALLESVQVNTCKRDFKFVEETADRIHRSWLERNGDWATEDQKVPYAQLSSEEQAKDRVIVEIALEFWGGN